MNEYILIFGSLSLGYIMGIMSMIFGALQRLGVEQVDRIDNSDTIDIVTGILDGLVKLGCVEVAHSERILKDVKEYIGE